MKRTSKIVILGLSLCLWAGNAQAKDWDLNTGKGLLRICSSEHVTEQVLCTGYIMGFMRGVGFQKEFAERFLKVASPKTLRKYPNILGLYCIPEGVRREQTGLIVKNYLLDNPNELEDLPEILISNALVKAFPCK